MANTYSWQINLLETAKSEDGLTDVVKIVHWSFDGTDGVNNVHTYGSASVGSPSPEHFTNYADLTEAQVIGWLENSLDVVAMKASIDGTLLNLANPPIVTLPLPWT